MSDLPASKKRSKTPSLGDSETDSEDEYVPPVLVALDSEGHIIDEDDTENQERLLNILQQATKIRKSNIDMIRHARQMQSNTRSSRRSLPTRTSLPLSGRPSLVDLDKDLLFITEKSFHEIYSKSQMQLVRPQSQVNIPESDNNEFDDNEPNQAKLVHKRVVLDVDSTSDESSDDNMDKNLGTRQDPSSVATFKAVKIQDVYVDNSSDDGSTTSSQSSVRRVALPFDIPKSCWEGPRHTLGMMQVMEPGAKEVATVKKLKDGSKKKPKSELRKSVVGPFDLSQTESDLSISLDGREQHLEAVPATTSSSTRPQPADFNQFAIRLDGREQHLEAVPAGTSSSLEYQPADFNKFAIITPPKEKEDLVNKLKKLNALELLQRQKASDLYGRAPETERRKLSLDLPANDFISRPELTTKISEPTKAETSRPSDVNKPHSKAKRSILIQKDKSNVGESKDWSTESSGIKASDKVITSKMSEIDKTQEVLDRYAPSGTVTKDSHLGRSKLPAEKVEIIERQITITQESTTAGPSKGIMAAAGKEKGKSKRRTSFSDEENAIQFIESIPESTSSKTVDNKKKLEKSKVVESSKIDSGVVAHSSRLNVKNVGGSGVSNVRESDNIGKKNVVKSDVNVNIATRKAGGVKKADNKKAEDKADDTPLAESSRIDQQLQESSGDQNDRSLLFANSAKTITRYQVDLNGSVIEARESNYLTQLPVVSEDVAKYVPILYTFRVKPKDKNKLENLVTQVPPFYVLMDHTIAVIWTLFNANANKDQLGIAQLQWALYFLQQIHNSNGVTPKDVTLCIEAIQDYLIDQYADMSEQSVVYGKDKFGDYAPVEEEPPVPFSINYTQMVEKLVLIEEDELPRINQELLEELEKVKKLVGIKSIDLSTTLSRDKTVNLITEWRQEQLVKIFEEIKTFRVVNDILTNLDNPFVSLDDEDHEELFKRFA